MFGENPSREVQQLVAERDGLKAEVRRLRSELAELVPPAGVSGAGSQGTAAQGAATRSVNTSPLLEEGLSFRDWLQRGIAAEQRWFHSFELVPGLNTPGWSFPREEKLPWFGVPADLTGLRVLDIGCADGFFSFEAERRGAKEIVSIDSSPSAIQRFNLCRAALGSKATAYLANVYEIGPRTLGTFDVVFCYGVLYHLRHPQLALEKVLSVCTGTLLLQSLTFDDPALRGQPMARFYPNGMQSGRHGEIWDPTVFWVPNGACCIALLQAVGFTEIEVVSREPNPFVLRTHSPVAKPGKAPDESTAPWS